MKRFIVLSYPSNPDTTKSKPDCAYGPFNTYNKAKSFAAGYTDYYLIVEYRKWVAL